MILKDLCDFYDLKQESGDSGLPERFWCTKSVMWELVIDVDGNPVECIPLATEKDGFVRLVVPDVQRTSGIKAFFACDDARYLLGLGDPKGEDMHAKSRELHYAVLDGVEDDAAAALLRFFDVGVSAEEPVALSLAESPKDLIVFRLEGDSQRIHERPAIKAAWAAYSKGLELQSDLGQCLVTGEMAPIAKLFPQVTGLPGAQSAGASLISCNQDSFDSYNQSIGPISQEVADKAGNALRYVLKDQSHQVRIGDDVFAFWTDADVAADDFLALLLNPDGVRSDNSVLPKGEDIDVRDAVQNALVQIRRGEIPPDVPQGARYHLLGIAPNNARLAVRLYQNGELGKLAENAARFMRDAEMVGTKPASMRAYLLQTAAQGEDKNIPKPLITACMQSFLQDRPFPDALLERVVGRMRADHGTNNNWDMGRRASILKACLVRKERHNHTTERGLTVSLNPENTNEGYLLGRLFALLEKAQSDAIAGANATIRDRYMGAASTTPARVYPQLLKMAQHHISKSEYGVRIDRLIQEVMGLSFEEGFPKTLSYDDQGMFYIGYYQQKQALYAKKTNDN